MEKENQKTRDDAIREFNDAVRALVLFVRRRDPRYVPTATTDAERQNTLKEAAAAQAARARKANAERLAAQAVPTWTQSRGDQEGDDYATDEAGEEGEADEDEEEGEEEEEEPEIWKCVVCSKTFKSEGQYDAHERSKKHKQAVFRLAREMRDEDVELGLKSEANRTEETIIDEAEDEADANSLPGELEEKLDLDDDDDDDDAGSMHQPPSNENTTTRLETPELPPMPTSDQQPPEKSSSESEAIDDSYAPRSKLEQSHTTANDPLIHPPLPPSKPKTAKEKRARRAAKAAATSTTASQTNTDGFGDESGALGCVACKEVFGSKNKLFEHIKRTGHARAIIVGDRDGGGRGGKRGRGR